MQETSMIHSVLQPVRKKPVLVWIAFCMLMVALMVVVGGLTRLTDSGLSMVNWHPIHGVLPPMNEAEWQEELQNYRNSPQYQQINKGMSVEEFKQIFWLEYIHRVLGRLVGFVFFLPLAFFLITRNLPRPLSLRMVGIFLLGGGQGLMGWYMVKSGLADVPWVSPIRLAMHLGLAFLIFGLLLWHYLLIKYPAEKVSHNKRLWGLSFVLMVVLFVQILLGALVAGLDAGLLFDSFPTMNGEWMPAGVLSLEPFYRNLYENPTAVHFIHRLGALLLTVAFVGFALYCHKVKVNDQVRRLLAVSALILLFQITLGALTVIYQVPIILASLHQLVALFLFAAWLTLVYSLRYEVRMDAQCCNTALHDERENVRLDNA